MSESPSDSVHKESRIIADHELMGEKANVSHSEAAHIGELTPEELVSIIVDKVIKLIWDSLSRKS